MNNIYKHIIFYIKHFPEVRIDDPFTFMQFVLAELQGKSQAWFEENCGRPSAKALRFFGGATWIYFQITDKKSPLQFFYDGPSDCQVSLDFDKEGKLKDSDYSGC